MSEAIAMFTRLGGILHLCRWIARCPREAEAAGYPVVDAINILASSKEAGDDVLADALRAYAAGNLAEEGRVRAIHAVRAACAERRKQGSSGVDETEEFHEKGDDHAE